MTSLPLRHGSGSWRGPQWASISPSIKGAKVELALRVQRAGGGVGCQGLDHHQQEPSLRGSAPKVRLRDWNPALAERRAHPEMDVGEKDCCPGHPDQGLGTWVFQHILQTENWIKKKKNSYPMKIYLGYALIFNKYLRSTIAQDV